MLYSSGIGINGWMDLRVSEESGISLICKRDFMGFRNQLTVANGCAHMAWGMHFSNSHCWVYLLVAL